MVLHENQMLIRNDEGPSSEFLPFGHDAGRSLFPNCSLLSIPPSHRLSPRALPQPRQHFIATSNTANPSTAPLQDSLFSPPFDSPLPRRLLSFNLRHVPDLLSPFTTVLRSFRR